MHKIACYTLVNKTGDKKTARTLLVVQNFVPDSVVNCNNLLSDCYNIIMVCYLTDRSSLAMQLSSDGHCM